MKIKHIPVIAQILAISLLAAPAYAEDASFMDEDTQQLLSEAELQRDEGGDDGDYDRDYIPLSKPKCGMTIGKGQFHRKYLLKDDIVCKPGDLVTTNAAITILGNGIELNMNGHTIIGPRTAPNNSSDLTADINAIGVYLKGYKSRLIGVLDEDEEKDRGENNYGTIYNFNVAVEVGTAEYEQYTVMNPEDFERKRKGHNFVSNVQGIQCNSGIRVLSDRNTITNNKMSCHLIPNVTEEGFKANDTAPAILGSSDGFVIGIKALTPGLGENCNSDNEKLPSIYYNRVVNNIAIANDNGFLGGNDMSAFHAEGLPFFNGINNVIEDNTVSRSSSNGILISGTGHKVFGNHSYNNRLSGVVVSRNNPQCGPQKGVVNEVFRNKATRNHYGIASVVASGETINQGTLFKKNRGFDNQRGNQPYDLYTDEDCANGEYELNTLNLWRGNVGSTNNVCTLAR